MEEFSEIFQWWQYKIKQGLQSSWQCETYINFQLFDMINYFHCHLDESTTLTEWNTTTTLMSSRQTSAGLKCYKIQTVVFVERSGFVNGGSCKATGAEWGQGSLRSGKWGHEDQPGPRESVIFFTKTEGTIILPLRKFFIKSSLMK